ncbi:hypothetical protein PNK_0963 [Candidatus Protochlamydia naegleriophila]|uniref:Uncharacterized protein n=1 Tax=Candidatus Protochlamydia naegleriophila TaxID=389348 RepID=A0A0U5CPD6_9BACT|nr:hypothetical protein [Candidatus Protochlamydia naegleriophila]CUI16588.1 hypothetical protein PNK_0963 [Candidatus Protochlamydia naegleriophila]
MSLEQDKRRFFKRLSYKSRALPLLECEREGRDPFFCNFYYNSRFCQLTIQACNQFQYLQTNRQRLIYLDALFKDAQTLFRASVKGAPSQELTQEKHLMRLLVLKIDIPPSFKDGGFII